MSNSEKFGKDFNESGAGAALQGGVSRDPNFKPDRPFFDNGKPRFEGDFPSLPVRLEMHPAIDSNSPYAEKFAKSNVDNLQIPRLNSRNGKVSPAYIHDQYLQNVEGGAQELVNETNSNYKRDFKDLPWRQDIYMRQREFPVTTITGNPSVSSSFNGKKREILVSPYNVELSAIGKKYNGFRDKTGFLTFSESVLHEISHAATYDYSGKSDDVVLKESKTLKKDAEQILSNKNSSLSSLQRPYQFASSEEYKVGALIFINKSRQLTGDKLTNPQKIHQLFDEIEKDPSILDKNYSSEEARLPRTYLLLKETNPKGAEILRNAVARDCQYLAKNGQERSNICKSVGELKGLKEVSQDVVTCMGSLNSSAIPSVGSLAKISQRLTQPVHNWVEHINSVARVGKSKKSFDFEGSLNANLT